MNKKVLYILLTSLMFLAGCIGGCGEQKKNMAMRDFAGVLFMLYALIVMVQMYSENIMSSKIVRKMNELFRPLRRKLPIIAYMIGVIYLLIGLYALSEEDIFNQIKLFIGLMFTLIGWFTKKYNEAEENLKERTKYAKLIAVSTTITIFFYFIITVGKEMLRLP